MIKKLIGNKAFYKMVLLVAIPIMVQNGITNFVSLLDNIMVGQVGTEQMSGVAIVNQLIFVFNLCIFGGLSGAGIFGAQYYGQGNHDGVRFTFRFKCWLGFIVTILCVAIFAAFGSELIQLFLHEGSGQTDIRKVLYYGEKYLAVSLLGLFPFMVGQVYSSTLRETGETILPMKAGIVAVFVNLVINYILIFGKFGAPALGAVGAAIGTVVSRFVECGIIMYWTHKHVERNPFIVGALRSMKIPKSLASKVLVKGAPLLINEALWSGGVSTMMQCYSVRGVEVIAGLNISNTIANLFNIVFVAMGSAISIIVGQLLGAGKMKEAKEADTKLIFFSVMCCMFIGFVMILIAPAFPAIYNTSEEVKGLAAKFIIVSALYMPQNAFMHAAYFTLRAGGKTVVTFFFDSVFMWVVNIPLAYFLSRYTGINIVYVFAIVQGVEIVKCVIGFILLKRGVWLQNIVV